MCNLCRPFGFPYMFADLYFFINFNMFNTGPDPLPCKEQKSLPPEVVEEAFRILAEEDVDREKR